MEEEQQKIRIQKIKLDVWALALAFGTIFGLYTLFMGGVAAWLGLGVEFVEFVGKIYPGFKPDFLGSLIGAVWGFTDGFMSGLILGTLYNWFLKRA